MKRIIILLLFVCCSLLSKVEGNAAHGVQYSVSVFKLVQHHQLRFVKPASVLFFDAAPQNNGNKHQALISLEQEDEDELARKDSLLLKLFASLLITFLFSAFLEGRSFQSQSYTAPFFADSGRYLRLRTFRI